MSLTVSGSIAFGDGTVNISLTIPVNASGLTSIATVELGSGAFTTFTVPTWAVGAIIDPSPSDTNTLKLKLLVGDTGNNISHIAPTVIALDNSNLPTAIYLESSGSDTVWSTVMFF